MDITAFLQNWIAISNSYDTEKYLDQYLSNAVLDDPSVGKKFEGNKGIRQYYENYFIGYKTQTKLLKLDLTGNSAHMEVLFTGTFPGGEIEGTFDFLFKDEKIAFVKAELR